MSYDNHFQHKEVMYQPPRSRRYRPEPRSKDISALGFQIDHGKGSTKGQALLSSMPRGQCSGAAPQGGVVTMFLGCVEHFKFKIKQRNCHVYARNCKTKP